MNESTVLHWRDLEPHEVFHIAHLENEARDAAAVVLSRAAYATDDEVRLGIIESATSLIEAHEARAESWLADQASIRGLRIYLENDGTSEISEFGIWLNEQFTNNPTVKAKTIAEKAGISQGYLSGLRRGSRLNPSDEAMARLRQAFASF